MQREDEPDPRHGDEPESQQENEHHGWPVRWTLRQAATWQLLAELFRRHHAARRLRIVESHPMDGQYDGISLWEGGFERRLAFFHIQSQNLHLAQDETASPSTRHQITWPWGMDYVTAMLAADDPRDSVDEVEGALGLPHMSASLPPSTPTVVVLRAIAAFHARVCLHPSAAASA